MMTYYFGNRKFLCQWQQLVIWRNSVNNWRSYERTNQAIKKNMHLPCHWPPRSKWPSRSHNIVYDTLDYPDLCDQLVTQSNVKKERDIRNWKLKDVMSTRPEVTSKSKFYEIKVTVILLLPKQAWSQSDNK